MRPVPRVHMVLAAVLGVALAVALLVPLGRLPGLPGLGGGGDRAGEVASTEALPAPARVAIPDTGEPVTPQAARFPAASESMVRVPREGAVDAGDAPIRLSQAVDAAAAPIEADVSVEVLDQAEVRARSGDPTAATGFLLVPVAGSDGVVPTKVDLRLDYSGFRTAFGGDYASRLRLFVCGSQTAVSAVSPSVVVAEPSMVVRPTAEVGGCARVALPELPDVQHSTITATVALTPETPESTSTSTSTSTSSEGAVESQGAGAVMVFASAGPSGSGGDYRATKLNPSDSWSVGPNTGNFTYSYPLPAAPAASGFAPGLSLDYDSARVDGMTSAENSQTSWIGQGWQLSENYVERVFRGCSVETEQYTVGDLCWGQARYVIHLNGRSSELIPSANNQFRLKDDPGWKVTRGLGAANGDGGVSDAGEYFVVQTQGGTDYIFGYGSTYGNGDGTSPAATNSTWTVPVFGDDAGEPCNAATFAASWCQQAWRWNLDRAVDDHGNVQSWIYQFDTNRYRRNGTTDTIYVRGGNLAGIWYGYRASGSGNEVKPTGRIAFTGKQRCSSMIHAGAATLDRAGRRAWGIS